MKLTTVIKGRLGTWFWTVFVLIFIASDMAARESINPKIASYQKQLQQRQALSELPVVIYAAHNRGNLQLAIANNGTFGAEGATIQDPITNQPIPSCVYPKNSNLIYLWVGGLWIGAIVDRDTLVSCAVEDMYQTREFWPAPPPAGEFEYRSMDLNSPFYNPDKLGFSEQDILCEYYDTVTNPALVSRDDTDQRSHRPLNIKVNQRSMAWSYSYADDFVLFDYQVTNIGFNRLKDVYMGIWLDGDALHISRNNPEGWTDDMVGFFRSYPAPEGCGFIDTLNIAWHADNDGDPEGGLWDHRSTRSVLGSMVVRTPSDSLDYSYNWWITNYSDITRDFGPRTMPTVDDPWRDFRGRQGTPEGDRNKYYVLSHPEFDYDLLTVAKDHTAAGYLPPPTFAQEIAYGFDSRYVLSFGPFNIDPGESLPISFAWVAGGDFHVNAFDFDDFDPLNPHIYLQRKNFGPLATNARWASWVYDNPGVDTDGDGYAGEFRVCVLDSILTHVDTIISGIDTTFIPVFDPVIADTFWNKGDGVPDFSGAGPPPAPLMRLEPTTGKLTARFNGFYSETTKDIFSGIVDFEGYRVFISRDNRRGSFSRLVSYDREDFNRYVYRPRPDGMNWFLEEIPFTLDSLRLLFNNPDFDPLAYRPSSPLYWEGEQYYFSAQDFNASDLNNVRGIRKAYPAATNPGKDPELWAEEDVTYEHGEPLPKYYEYVYEIDYLLPTVPYYVAVTTFDFGSPISGLPALETDLLNNMIVEYPLPSEEAVERDNLKVYVYPNPYVINDSYTTSGFENLGTDLIDERARRIHFANLPPRCTISIYSLDGDLVREIEHDKDPLEPSASHDTWDLITRNTQTTVSGLYYWVVESDDGVQMGKLAIIL